MRPTTLSRLRLPVSPECHSRGELPPSLLAHPASSAALAGILQPRPCTLGKRTSRFHRRTLGRPPVLFFFRLIPRPPRYSRRSVGGQIKRSTLHLMAQYLSTD